jgi:hypothetical protein
MPKPAAGSHPSYFDRYISLVPEEDLMTAFINQLPVIKDVFSAIDEKKSKYAYAPGKWTLKELLQHMIDTERIFAYRSLCFARKEHQSLPGFDENSYADNSQANNRSWVEMCEEFLLVRKTSEVLFSSFTEEALNNPGNANNNPVTALSMGFTSIGHVYHHFNVIKERYL